MSFNHHTQFNAPISFVLAVPCGIYFSVSSIFGKYGSQIPKFGTASNDVTVIKTSLEIKRKKERR
jgi:hypothetical protein